MSRTVSFRASEKLDEFLEQEAERRLVTKSTVAQMMVAERYRQLQGERPDDDRSTREGVPDVTGKTSGRGVFERHSEQWYEPNSSRGYEYAVRTKGGRTKYYKTRKGARERLLAEYSE